MFHSHATYCKWACSCMCTWSRRRYAYVPEVGI